MTFEGALGYKPTDLEDFVMAHVMLPIVKHTDCDDPRDAAQIKIDRMTNTDFLSVLSMGLQELLNPQA
jgi:hypothetical protein